MLKLKTGREIEIIEFPDLSFIQNSQCLDKCPNNELIEDIWGESLMPEPTTTNSDKLYKKITLSQDGLISLKVKGQSPAYLSGEDAIFYLEIENNSSKNVYI